MNNRDLFLRSTSVEGAETLTEHRCWNADRFYLARHDEAQAANERVQRETGKPPKFFASVEPITQAQYRAARAPRTKS